MSRASQRRTFLRLILTTSLAAGLIAGLAGPLAAPARLMAGDQGGNLQQALERTQQDLLNLKKNLETEGRTTRRLAIEDLQGILRVLEKAIDRAPANDPCLPAALQIRGHLINLINAILNGQVGGRRALVEELDLLIGLVDGFLGKW